jgi:diguanylate cyclase
MLRVIGCITQQHDLNLVVLAACICALACGTTLNLIERARNDRKRRFLLPLLTASAVFGCGVWSLHFVAMLAFVTSFPVTYGVPLTTISVVFAVVGTMTALCVWRYYPVRLIGVGLGGALLGMSVSIMHYAGVMAMQLPGSLRFDQGTVMVSITVSIGFAILALARSNNLASFGRRVEVTVWLTLSICGMHFIGMTALEFHLGPADGGRSAGLGSSALGISVGTVSLAILLIGLAATLMEQRLSKRALLELQRMRLLSDMSQEVLVIYRDGLILLINAAGGRMFGVPDEQLVGRRLLDFVEAADHPTILRRVQQSEVDLGYEEISIKTARGAVIPAEFACNEIDFEGKPSAMMAIRDLSDRKRDEEKMRHLAYHDALTDLPNRAMLQERLGMAMDAAARSAHVVALLYLDLDRFKPVNDMFGHAAGDALLIDVANRLRANLRVTDTLARVGGDEFVIVATFERQEDAAPLAGRLIASLAQPIDLAAGRVEIGASIGIALYPGDGDTQDALLRAADLALYRAKNEKRGTFRFFEASMDEHLQARQQLEQDLRVAITHGQLRIYYQPMLNCATGKLVGYEALLRWHHPSRGLIPPLDFIPMAEETGLIVEIGQWVIETACKEAAEWQEPLWIAINVSPVQIRQSDLRSVVAATLALSGLPASRLEIEMTESALMEDVERASKVLSDVRRLGVRLALDDFGTGYSSLSYLQAFKFDKLKIDRSFVSQIRDTDGASIIVRAIIDLAHNLDLLVTAEGIETAEQLAIIRDFGCDQVQGYLLGKPSPMPVSADVMALATRRLFAGSVEERDDSAAAVVGSAGILQGLCF